MSRLTATSAGLGAALAVCVLASAPSPGWSGDNPPMARLEVAAEAPAFSLTDQDGRRVGLGDLRGRAVLLAFIYTSCPDVCPLMVESVAAVQRGLGAVAGEALACVFVTTDPEIDTPGVLKAYATRRGADLSSTMFLTGSPGELQPVWHGFGVKVMRRARGLVSHTPLTLLIDPRGIIRYRYLGGVLDAETVLADSVSVLGEERGRERCHE